MLIENPRGFFFEFPPLSVQDVILNTFGLNGAECPHTHVQGDVDPFDSARGQTSEDRLGKVEPCGGCCDGAGRAGVDGLVASTIVCAFLSLADVGRKRHGTVPLEERERRFVALGSDDPTAFVLALQCQPKSVPDDDSLSGLRAPARRGEDFPVAAGEDAEEKSLPAASRRLPMSEEPGGDHPGVVPHKDVVWSQQVRNVREHPVLPAARVTVDDHQSRSVPRFRGILSDEFVGKREIKFRRSQTSSSGLLPHVRIGDYLAGVLNFRSDCTLPVQSLVQRLEKAERSPWPAEPVPVALVITDLDVGGAERILVALATRLNRQRWRPQVICLGPEGKMIEPLRAAELPTVCLDANKRRPFQAVSRLVGALRAVPPRLVQSFLFHANVASRLAAPLARVPWVLSGHRVAEHEKRWHLTLDRLTSNLASGSVCVSQGVLRFTRDLEGVSERRLVVITNGVDTAALDAAAPLPRSWIGVPDGGHLALFIGRLDVQKGLPFLFDAAEQVIAARDDWYLVLVGDGAEREWVRRRIAQTPALAERVHWLGRRDDVPRLLKSADVLVLSSLWEGMPNVVLEAMAARKPVVATNVEGSEDLVIPGKSGWLVPPRDSNALARALLEAAGDPERCRRFGESARQIIENGYSIETMVLAYERLWAGVLGLEF